MSQLCGNKEYTLNKAQNVFEIFRFGYLVLAYLGYNIPCELEHPTSAIMPNLLKYLLQKTNPFDIYMYDLTYFLSQ